MARPTHLTPELIEQARVIVPRCGSFEIAADFLGVNRRTMSRWMKEGRSESRRRERGIIDPAKDLHLDFAAAVDRAMAEQVANCLDRINMAAEKGQWQAAAWLLERRYPLIFGRRESAELAKLEKDVRSLERSVHSTAARS